MLNARDLGLTFDEFANPRELPSLNQTAQTAVLSAYLQATDPKGAKEFLNHLVNYYQQQGRLEAPPDLVMHNIVLNAWAIVASGSGPENSSKQQWSYNIPFHTMLSFRPT
jgi:hypothetical protein